MLRAALLAIALIIPAVAMAQTESSATEPAAQPCSAHVHALPSCDISKSDQKAADQHYRQGLKLERKKKYEEALKELQAARAISPRESLYMSAEQKLKEEVASDSLHKGNAAMLSGDATAALKDFQRAAEATPTNEYAQQRLRDALPQPDAAGGSHLTIESGEMRLRPDPVTKSFDFKGGSLELIPQFTRAFGIEAELQPGVTQRNARLKLDNVDWVTGSGIVAHLCKVLVIPMGERRVLVANDTEENRRDLTRMVLRTFSVSRAGSTQELTDLTTGLRVLFDLRFIASDAAQQLIVIRAPQPTMDAVVKFMDAMNSLQPTVMLDIKVFLISTTFTRDLGTSVPNSFSVFNIGSEIRNLLNSSAYQQAVQALQAAGQQVNALSIIEALLASSASTSLLSQPFATFGGGIVESAVTIPTTTLHFSDTRSASRTLDQALLRAGDGKAATMKVGERYPIVNTQYAAVNAESSLLSSLGYSTSAALAGTTVPQAQINYEDLGLVLKTTPHVHGKLISMDYELQLRSLGATQSNGLPLISNQEIKGTISTDDGESVVIAGMADKSLMHSLDGIPVLSSIPILGKEFSVESRETSAGEVLVLVTPHLVMNREGGQQAWIPVPVSVPK
jgi:type II secretory pathway component GspD/PulD (secretin)